MAIVTQLRFGGRACSLVVLALLVEGSIGRGIR